MKSRRVAKLLACALTIAMTTATPVFATAANNGKITTDFGTNSPVMTVKIDTNSQIRVNPLHSSGTDLKQFKLASKNISINNTSKDGDGVSFNVLVTATAKITKKGADVKAYYEAGASSASKFVGSDSSIAKECYMELQKGSGTATSQATYSSTFAGTDSAVVTTQGSRLQFKVPAATATAAGYAEYALVGDANTQAGWTNNDLNVEMTYALSPVTDDASVTGTNAPTIAAVTGTSGNALSINNFVTDAQLAGAAVQKLAVYDQKMKSPEAEWNQDKFTWARNTADDAYNVTIAADDPMLTWLGGSDAKGKTYGLLVVFTDGRVAKTTITIS